MNSAIKLMVGYLKMTGMTQKEMASMIGADSAQVSRWMTGKHIPCKAWQMRIAHVIDGMNRPRVIAAQNRIANS